MSESLNVIALISGGKDSIYSILHCLRNGHKVVALGNLFPPPNSYDGSTQGRAQTNEEDLNSFMYQTVGHTIIPLYEKALGIPLYRQQIQGTAVQTGSTYQFSPSNVDETESLIPLLRIIIEAHPEATAISTGAILSTYQRTRVESVALRLGLIPLSFLWQYPALPPTTQVSLLEDMASVGLDARIIKVASGGLDESFLWQNVASIRGMQRIERAMARFGVNEDGAVLGEGGEFETLALDGPANLFAGRVVMEDADREVIMESGGTAWLKAKRARVEMKERHGMEDQQLVRIPDLLETRFRESAWSLPRLASSNELVQGEFEDMSDGHEMAEPISTKIHATSSMGTEFSRRWMVVARRQSYQAIEHEVEDILEQMRSYCRDQDIKVSNVVSTVILLRSMRNFALVNKIYAGLFTETNPPARVTIACGDVLPTGCNIIIQVNVFRQTAIQHLRKALHVQSRSYWAPANIGPYSQAHSVPLLSTSESGAGIFAVHIAGQIPLIPSTMELPSPSMIPALKLHREIEDDNPILGFKFQVLLSLQHLWRIGKAMDVSWWTGAVAYLPRDTRATIFMKARLAGAAWEYQHLIYKPKDEVDDGTSDEETDRDLWEERHHGGLSCRGTNKTAKDLPNWSILESGLTSPSLDTMPPFFAAEVQELPRGSLIEWHAILGVTNGPIKMTSHTHPATGSSAQTCTIASRISYTTIFIPDAREISSLDETLDSLLSPIEAPWETRRRKEASGYRHSYAAYLDVSVRGLWESEDYGGVVPCWSLWGLDGSRFAAVLIFESYSERGVGED